MGGHQGNNMLVFFAGNEVIFIMGGAGESVSRSTELLDLGGTTLPATADFPDQRGWFQGHYLPPSLDNIDSSSVLVCGSEYGGQNARRQCTIATDLVNGPWEGSGVVGLTNHNQYYQSGAVLGDRVYLMPGRGTNTGTEWLNTTTLSWTTGPDTPGRDDLQYNIIAEKSFKPSIQFPIGLNLTNERPATKSLTNAMSSMYPVGILLSSRVTNRNYPHRRILW